MSGGTGAGRRRALLAAGVVAVLLLWLVGLPLLVAVLEALRAPDGGTSLEAFEALVTRPDERVALWRSLWISAASVLLSALVGIPLAFVFERLEFPGRRVLGALVALPVALPPLVGVIAFLFLYGESGFVSRVIQAGLGLERPPWRLQGPGAILLVHTYSMSVYFYLFVRAALARLDGATVEAAAALGAGRIRTFFHVLLPQLRPALVGAGLLVFMTSLGSFSAPYIFAGGWRVMTTQILASKTNGDLALAQAEAVALAVLAFGALLVVRRFQGPEIAVAGHGAAPLRRRRPGRVVALVSTGLGWGLALLLLLPHLTLLVVSFVPVGTWTTELIPPVLDLGNYRGLFSQLERLRPIVNSLWMATVAALGAAVLGLAAARWGRKVRGRLGSALEALVVLPWAVPGTVFAVALAATFSVKQPWFGRFLWVGTPIILPLAYLVRCLPITGRSAVAALRQFDPALEEAAEGLGAGVVRRWARVLLPALRPALVAGLGLGFITALGDFVTSIVLFTWETRPISMEIASSLRVQEFGVASAYGVLLMLLSAAAFLLWGQGEAVRQPQKPGLDVEGRG